MNIAVVTDTNSGINQTEAQQLGIHLIPMPFIVNGKEYFEGVSCTQEQFFDMLAHGDDVSTSQPSPESITSVWNELLKTHDGVVHIPMSSALSGSCQTAKALAEDYAGKVRVVDNKRISISQRQSVLDAITLAQKGMTVQQIGDELERLWSQNSIYLAVNTLELLKKSGRVTAAGAALATVLGLKPVLQIQGEKLDAFAKVRGMQNAESVMFKAIEQDLSDRFADQKVAVVAAYSGEKQNGEQWLQKVREHFKDETIEIYPLPISICCHIGDGVRAIACIGIVE